MDTLEKYIFLAFGELALDVLYNEEEIIRETGGVSAFNTLYNLSIFGEETYAIGGVGYDITDMNENIGARSAIRAIRAIESLKKVFTNVDEIELINKPTNIFYIFKPKKKLEINEDLTISRISPITGKSTINWSDELNTTLPRKFEGKRIVLVVSNFEPVTDIFIDETKRKSKESIISLDITNGKIFDKYPDEYLWRYLRKINLIQCNKNTASILCKKLHIESVEKLVSLLNTEIFTLTKGGDGATFFYRDNESLKSIDRIPKKIERPHDPTGAGDAFHTMMLLSYCRMKYNNTPIDEKYFDKAFKIANAFSRKVLQIQGARGEPKEILEFMVNEIKEEEQELEIN